MALDVAILLHFFSFFIVFRYYEIALLEENAVLYDLTKPLLLYSLFFQH